MLGKSSESSLSSRLFDLVYELNTIAPSVLLAVLPQLEFKLKVGHLDVLFDRVYELSLSP